MNERKHFTPDMLPRRARYLARERTLLKRIRRHRNNIPPELVLPGGWIKLPPLIPRGWDWNAIVAACGALQKTGSVDKAFDVYLVSVVLMEGM